MAKEGVVGGYNQTLSDARGYNGMDSVSVELEVGKKFKHFLKAGFWVKPQVVGEEVVDPAVEVRVK